MLKLQKVVALVHYGFAALKAVGNLIAKEFENVKESMTLGEELNELSARAGIAVSDLVSLRDEFKKVGKRTEDIGPAISKMQRAFGLPALADLLQKSLSLQPVEAIVSPRVMLRWIDRAFSKTHSMRALLVDVQIERHVLFPERRGESQRVLHFHAGIFPRMPDEARGRVFGHLFFIGKQFDQIRGWIFSKEVRSTPLMRDRPHGNDRVTKNPDIRPTA